jgi:hypothetical protein
MPPNVSKQEVDDRLARTIADLFFRMDVGSLRKLTRYLRSMEEAIFAGDRDSRLFLRDSIRELLSPSREKEDGRPIEDWDRELE